MTKFEQAYQIALENNLFGKRLRSSQLKVVEMIEYGNLSSGTLLDKLLQHHAEQKVMAKQAAVKVEVPVEPVVRGNVKSKEDGYKILEDGTYIISAAQNNTEVHAGLLGNIELLAQDINAQIIFMPLKYTTNLDALSKKEPFYVKAVKPYILEENAWIGGIKGVRLQVTSNILPTAKQPINTAAKINNGEALTIVAHTKRQLKTLPRQKNGKHKWALTTGAVTQRHYTDTRAGDEGEQQHFFGFVVVKVSNGLVYFTEVEAKEDGSFNYGLTSYYEQEKQDSSVAAMVLGDLHCEKMCMNSWGKAIQQVSYYKPRVVALHDVLDFMSRNHHNRASGKFLYQMGQRAVIDDLNDVIAKINELAQHVETVYIVQSNHDLALDRWLDCPHYRPEQDPINAKVYHFLKYCLYEAIDNGEGVSGLELAAKNLITIAPQLIELSDKVVFGEMDASYTVAGYDLSHHGHQGTNGARGCANAFLAFGTAMVTGHTHSPYRDGKLLTVGVTGSLEMGYNKGGTSWDRANAVIYEDGTSSLVMPYWIGEAQY